MLEDSPAVPREPVMPSAKQLNYVIPIYTYIKPLNVTFTINHNINLITS